MTIKKAHITARIPAEHLEDLHELARLYRMETGEDVRLADQVRTAVAEYLDRRTDHAKRD